MSAIAARAPVEARRKNSFETPARAAATAYRRRPSNSTISLCSGIALRTSKSDVRCGSAPSLQLVQRFKGFSKLFPRVCHDGSPSPRVSVCRLSGFAPFE